jgi:hypothetical protein
VEGKRREERRGKRTKGGEKEEMEHKKVVKEVIMKKVQVGGVGVGVW